MSTSIRAPSSDFPSDVLKWMKQNAKPQIAVKLMKVHKYFQHKDFPYAVVEQIYGNPSWGFNCGVGVVDCTIITLNDEEQHFIGPNSFEAITKPLWITEVLAIFSNGLAKCIIPKIILCDVRELDLENLELSFKDFQFLTSTGSVKKLMLEDTKINYKNGDPVSINSIFECVPNMKKFDYDICNIDETALSPVVFTEACKNINGLKVTKIFLSGITFTDFQHFSKFMEKKPLIYYIINFAKSYHTGQITEDEYKTINSFCDRIQEIRTASNATTSSSSEYETSTSSDEEF